MPQVNGLCLFQPDSLAPTQSNPRGSPLASACICWVTSATPCRGAPSFLSAPACPKPSHTAFDPFYRPESQVRRWGHRLTGTPVAWCRRSFCGVFPHRGHVSSSVQGGPLLQTFVEGGGGTLDQEPWGSPPRRPHPIFLGPMCSQPETWFQLN